MNGQLKVNKVSPRSARSIQGQEMPVKVSLCHNFNKSRDGPTWSGIELLRAAKKY